MRILIVGYGVQGKKRYQVADKKVVAIVDPVSPEADYKKLSDVPLSGFDVAFLCVPDGQKIELLKYLLMNQKPTLVEKPLLFPNENTEKEIQHLAKKTLCYTAYNHRFEPHIQAMKACLTAEELGKIYSIQLFYGNGTAREVRGSPWRDQGSGVIRDLGSHLLDTCLFWFGKGCRTWHFKPQVMERYENQAPDYAILTAEGPPYCELQMTLLSWRNEFRADILAEKGSAHIHSLCKWGPSDFIRRYRVLPSGRPREEVITLVQSDPTWALEEEYFLNLVREKEEGVEPDILNLERDRWIQGQICQPPYSG